MTVRYESFNASATAMDLLPAGCPWDFHEDPEPLDVHGVMVHADEAAIFTGTKAELQSFVARLAAWIDQLPDDRPDGSAKPTTGHDLATGEHI